MVFVTRPHRKEQTLRNKGDHLSSQKEKEVSDEVFMVLRKVPSFLPCNTEQCVSRLSFLLWEMLFSAYQKCISIGKITLSLTPYAKINSSWIKAINKCIKINH